MKKVFGILGTGLLLVSNALMSFGNVSFAFQNNDIETETNGCYVYEHYFMPTKGTASSYLGSELIAYKCDTEGGIVDLRDAPLEEGQYIVAIGEDAFSGTNVTKVIMPSTIEYIGNGAFCNAKREGGPVCGNGVIELGEECDDGNIISIRGMDSSYVCDNQCKKMLAPVCGNGIREQYENCFNCKIDVEADGGNCTKSIDDGQELEYKGEYIDTKATATPVDNTNFVVVDFPDGMNDELWVSDLDYACAKLQEYNVTFKTETGTIMVETEYQYINPVDVPFSPDREGFIGGWYLGDELFDINQHIIEDITLEYKYVKGGVEYDEENGWIRVKLGDQEIIVKDRNQWAEKSFNEVNTGDFTDLVGAAGSYYLWGNNIGLDIGEVFDDNGQILDNVNLPEGFEHGYLGMEGGNDWASGSDDTPCDASNGEYLPSPDDWKQLMLLWGKINGYNLYNDEMGYFFDDMGIVYPDTGKGEKSLNIFLDAGLGGESSVDSAILYSSAIEKLFSDLYILGVPPLHVENGGVNFSNNPSIFPASLNNGNIGYFAINGLYLLDVSTLNNGFINSLATPVRCFVKPIKHEEEKVETPKQGMSGGGGRGSSKVSDTTDKSHSAADDKTNSNSEEKIVSDKGGIKSNSSETVGKTNESSQKKVTYVPNKNLSEMENAYSFSHSYGITTKTSVQNAKMNSPLTRIQMAKMLSNYAMNVLGMQPDVSKGTIKFNDVTNKMDKQYDNGVTLAYQFGIMGINMPNNNFRPNDEVTRAEFVTALSRLLYGTSDGGYKSTSKYYEPHMAKLYGEGIINKADPTMKEKRGYVMLMLMRSTK